MGLPEAARFLGVTEADVMAAITEGDSQGQEDRIAIPHHESRDRRISGRVSSVTALGKRPCPDCGGEMEWNAAKQAIACPYCGFVPKEQPTSAAEAAGVAEHDLEKALAGAGDDHRGYGTETVKVKCQSCNAISVFEPSRVAQRCDFCGSPSIVPYQETRDAITPETLLPVKLDAPRVSRYRQELGALPLVRSGRPEVRRTDRHAESDLSSLLDLRRFCPCRLDRHVRRLLLHDRESTPTPRASGRPDRCSTSAGIRAPGNLDHFFDDDLVPGTVGVRMDLLTQGRAVSHKGSQTLRSRVRARLDRRAVSGGSAKAAELNRGQMDQQMQSLCGQQVPGDTHRDLQVQTAYARRTFKHILVPVWLVTYTFGPKTFQVLVNGYTGSTAGDRPDQLGEGVFLYRDPCNPAADHYRARELAGRLTSGHLCAPAQGRSTTRSHNGCTCARAANTSTAAWKCSALSPPTLSRACLTASS